jgi:uncharacterized iron-regulated membrane protein
VRPTARGFLLGLHRYVGLASAAFLVIAGLTGSILAFAEDYDRRTHPSLWRVTPAGARLSEQTLVDRIRGRLANDGSAARIEEIRLAGDQSSQLFALTDGRMMFVNPYTGAVLGTTDHPSKVAVFVGWVHQLHVRLLAGNWGERLVDLATAGVFLLVPTGVYLWWDKKRLTLKWTASWRRINWDLHNVAGLYGSVLIFLLAATGLLVAFETPLYWMARSEPWRPEAAPHPVPPGPNGSGHVPALDALILAAERALPGSETYQIQLPMRPHSSVQLLQRKPGVPGHSTVYFDRYDSRILRVDDLSKLPRAYRAHFLNQAIHMGTILGLPSKILLSLSSLLLVVLVVTGCVMWWQRA